MVPDQTADIGLASHQARGIAGVNLTIGLVIPDQTANAFYPGHAARGVASGDLAPVVPDQSAHVLFSRHMT